MPLVVQALNNRIKSVMKYRFLRIFIHERFRQGFVSGKTHLDLKSLNPTCSLTYELSF